MQRAGPCRKVKKAFVSLCKSRNVGGVEVLEGGRGINSQLGYLCSVAK